MSISFSSEITSFLCKSNLKLCSKENSVIKFKVTGLITIAFACILFLSCSNDNDGAKKADPATQSNEQRGEDHKEGIDSAHEGMDHNAPGMDTMHR